jgi:hypothetical protein
LRVESGKIGDRRVRIGEILRKLEEIGAKWLKSYSSLDALGIMLSLGRRKMGILWHRRFSMVIRIYDGAAA